MVATADGPSSLSASEPESSCGPSCGPVFAPISRPPCDPIKRIKYRSDQTNRIPRDWDGKAGHKLQASHRVTGTGNEVRDSTRKLPTVLAHSRGECGCGLRRRLRSGCASRCAEAAAVRSRDWGVAAVFRTSSCGSMPAPIAARGASCGDIQMVRPILLAALAACLLAACSQAPTLFSPSVRTEQSGGVLSNDDVILVQQRAAATSPSPSQQPGPVRHIAVTRSLALRMPAHEVAAIQQKHLAECAKLGCTVLESYLNRLNDGRTSGRVSVRLTPDRYPDFAAVITAPPVEVVTQSERAEDRTA